MAFKSSSAEKPEIQGLQYHTRLKAGDIPPYVLVPGDPKRVAKIAQLWDKAEEVADYRQYVTYKGEYKGAKLTATSSGIGSPGLAIAFDELLCVGVHTFIRVGTCGSLQPDMAIGDLVITTGAVRLDGASKDYVIPEYPAVAHYQVVEALIKAAKIHKVKYHVGITASTDTFTVGQGRPAFNDYLPSHKANIFEDMQKAGVKNFEMEAGCLLTLANLFSVRAGAICVVIADRVHNEFKITDEMEQSAALVASEAVRLLQRK
ncbi:MAG: Uridine phosphorylase (Udp) [Candidatus Beckwithbacteria bacterium GW2011_GWA2_43_10]|uniref:Uridine phosphorylase (Udp) n=1 Tax=Candidatus Beckwithbacteria bacterium GW2011_GWA2_43_10 TaxID=1618369 RepID=A0A0G1C4U0_9BACT|nr:MAG: Uridine phosphorylase (Udp) [Candidatus Beckwithbacteria bacterium GW2011_GWA2_43_10]